MNIDRDLTRCWYCKTSLNTKGRSSKCLHFPSPTHIWVYICGRCQLPLVRAIMGGTVIQLYGRSFDGGAIRGLLRPSTRVPQKPKPRKKKIQRIEKSA